MEYRQGTCRIKYLQESSDFVRKNSDAQLAAPDVQQPEKKSLHFLVIYDKWDSRDLECRFFSGTATSRRSDRLGPDAIFARIPDSTFYFATARRFIDSASR